MLREMKNYFERFPGEPDAGLMSFVTRLKHWSTFDMHLGLTLALELAI